MLRKCGSMVLVLGGLFIGNGYAQQFVFHPHKFGTNLFAGGIDNPRFQFIDIDGDGDHDLFILDRDERLQFYRNNNGQYTLEPDQRFGLIVGSWFHFVDIDGDGDNDCFTNGDFSEVGLFTNSGSAVNPSFQLASVALLDSSGNAMSSERFSVPTFADIDADGDLDFFTGSQNGSVTFYKNIGDPSQHQFKFITGQFDGINIQGPTLGKVMHGASGIEFFDTDSNGTLDLFWGDYFNTSMYVLKNIGTPRNARYLLTDSTYPKEAIVKTFGFNIPQHVDVDEDGFTDLVVGSVFPTESVDNFWFYKNTGSNAQPYYSLQTKNYLPMIDAGTRSTVAVADVDGDGDKDLVIGSGEGTVKFFINSGTPFQPSFSSNSTQEFQRGNALAAVACSDLDGDNRPDLLVGSYTDGIKFFKNLSTAHNITFTRMPFPLDTVNVGNSAAPCIADLDGDGKIDLLIGNSAGVLQYYKNVGASVDPSYLLVSTKFNSIDVGSDAVPFAAGVDGDGKTDLFIGNSEGKIFQYEFNPATLQFDSVDAFFQGINVRINAAPAFADIDGDGDNDLFVGNGKGGVYFYENTSVNSIKHSSSLFGDFHLFQNYPNPFNPSTTVSYQIPAQSFVTLKVYDLLGKEITALVDEVKPAGTYSLRWDAAGIGSGVYFCVLSASGFIQAKKIILLR